MLKKFFLTILLFATFILAGCVTQGSVNGESHSEAAQDVKGNLKISMLNIGYGDSILIQTSNQTILIDTGNAKSPDLFVNELKKFSVAKIDKLILTHPHSDHIGNAKLLIAPSAEELATYPYLEKISVGEVYDNGVVWASKLYRSYLQALDTKGMTHQSLKIGDVLDFGDGVEFKVLFPTAEFVTIVNENQFDENDKEHKEYNINNGSIVGKLTYKNFSMLFTGDCEKQSEAKILANNAAEDLKCDVLKGGHHGSGTSSTKAFVEAVNPSYVLLSSAEREKDDIAKGHPHLKPLRNYLAAGINKQNIFSTRFNGSITIISDGKNFSVVPEIKEDWLDKWMTQKEQKK